jgi:flagellar basal-body rod protein FlgB
MDPTRLAIFDLADRRLAHIGRRQELLAQNIANADTPGWAARDMKPFAEQLKQRGAAADLARTDARHIPPRQGGANGHVLGGEASPDGNSVVLDAELGKIADSESAHALVTGIYQKYLAMFRTAAGR